MEFVRLLSELAGEFVKQAYAAGENAMPAYTHMQRAEPVLVAHWLLAYAEMFLARHQPSRRLPQAPE